MACEKLFTVLAFACFMPKLHNALISQEKPHADKNCTGPIRQLTLYLIFLDRWRRPIFSPTVISCNSLLGASGDSASDLAPAAQLVIGLDVCVCSSLKRNIKPRSTTVPIDAKNRGNHAVKKGCINFHARYSRKSEKLHFKLDLDASCKKPLRISTEILLRSGTLYFVLCTLYFVLQE